MSTRFLPLVAALAAGCASSTPPAGLVTNGGSETGSSSGGVTSAAGTTSGTVSSSTSAATSSGAGSSTGGGTTSGGSTSAGTTSASTSSTGGSTGPTCTPGAIPDPCADQGLACHGAFGKGTCELPQELDSCSTTTGCATSDLSCLEIFAHSGIYLCLRSCNTIADCPNATTTCFADSAVGGNICFYNVCGPDWPLPIPPTSGPSYYGPCTAQATNDGVCLPVESQLGTVGVCLQGGAVSSGGVCSGDRVDGGADQLCPTGSICAAAGGAYACTPLCAFNSNGALDGGGPNCAAGTTCAQVLSASYDFGQCLTSCSESGMCAGSSLCVAASPTQSVCYP